MSTALNNLTSAWRELDLSRAPYALPDDLAIFDKARADESRSCYTVHRSYREYLLKGLEHPKDNRLNLGLLPQPWCGDLRSATVFILLLNPGLNPGDYFGEYQVRSYKKALIDNLQSIPNTEYPLLFLNPEFSWHPGARYWRARLHWLVVALADLKGIPYQEALREVARKICCIQLVPYHSAVFGLPGRTCEQLQSALLSKKFVKEDLARRKDALIVATRRYQERIYPNKKNIINYVGSETRAAHLSRQSKGGKEIAAYFGLPDQ